MDEEELQRLYRKAERLAREQQRVLDEIERTKAEMLPPEERRRRLRVIPGGSAVVAVLAWLWAWRPARPVLAALTSGLLGALLIGMPASTPSSPGADSPPAASPPPRAGPPPTTSPRPRADPAPARGQVAPRPIPPAANPSPTAAPRPPGRPPAPAPQPPSPPPTPSPTSPPASPAPTPEAPCVVIELLGFDVNLCLDDILDASPQDRDARVTLKII